MWCVVLEHMIRGVLVVFLVFLILASCVSARGIVAFKQPKYRMWVENNGSATVGEPYKFLFYGYDGRPHYGVEVRFYLDGSFAGEVKSNAYGKAFFTPPLPGRYEYVVDQGRYYGIGGFIEAFDPPGVNRSQLTRVEAENMRVKNHILYEVLRSS